MSTVKAHPALKAAVPFAPMVDGWMGDDWFHNGAFREDGTLQYTYGQEATRGNNVPGGRTLGIPTRLSFARAPRVP